MVTHRKIIFGGISDGISGIFGGISGIFGGISGIFGGISFDSLLILDFVLIMQSVHQSNKQRLERTKPARAGVHILARRTRACVRV